MCTAPKLTRRHIDPTSFERKRLNDIKTRKLCKTVNNLRSQKKSPALANNAKFLLAVFPAGLALSISRDFGGRASDKIIFNEKEYINKLPTVTSGSEKLFLDGGRKVFNYI